MWRRTERIGGLLPASKRRGGLLSEGVEGQLQGLEGLEEGDELHDREGAGGLAFIWEQLWLAGMNDSALKEMDAAEASGSREGRRCCARWRRV